MNMQSKERKLRKREATRKYNLLIQDGFKTAKQYSGWNMSAHPQGPMIDYQCPDCYGVSKARAGSMRRTRDVGFAARCHPCGRKIIIPISFS